MTGHPDTPSTNPPVGGEARGQKPEAGGQVTLDALRNIYAGNVAVTDRESEPPMAPSPAHPDILSVEDAARYLGISKLSMYKLIRDKKRRVPVKTVAGAFKISRRQLLDWFESL